MVGQLCCIILRGRDNKEGENNMPSKPVPNSEVGLGVCKCEPIAEYRAQEGKWVVRLSLECTSPESFLPLFVHIYRKNGRFSVELESDQTDYNKPGIGWVIKRAYLRGLRFWKREE